jgi:hypothetical protein
VLQSILLFFAVVIIAVSGLRGKEVISSRATVRLLGASIVLATSIFLADSQLDPGRLTPVMLMRGMSLVLFFSKTEGEDPVKLERVPEASVTRSERQPNGSPNG